MHILHTAINAYNLNGLHRIFQFDEQDRFCMLQWRVIISHARKGGPLNLTVLFCFRLGIELTHLRCHDLFRACLFIPAANVFFIVNHRGEGLLRLEKVLRLAHRSPQCRSSRSTAAIRLFASSATVAATIPTLDTATGVSVVTRRLNAQMKYSR